MGLFQELCKESAESVQSFRQYLVHIRKLSPWLYLSFLSMILGILIIIGVFLYTFLPVVVAFLTNSPSPRINFPTTGPVSIVLIAGFIIACGPQFISVILVSIPLSFRSQLIKNKPSTNDQKPSINERDEVFIVHGHDEILLNEVAVYLSSIKIDPIILKNKTNDGMGWLFTKFKKHSNVKFAVVLYTPDDIGMEKSDKEYSDRPRQNVILELGFFLGKLGNERVWILCKDFIETPSDIIGGTVQKYDVNGGWKHELIKSLVSAGIRFEQS
jgi:hypothetical protein